MNYFGIGMIAGTGLRFDLPDFLVFAYATAAFFFVITVHVCKCLLFFKHRKNNEIQAALSG